MRAAIEVLQMLIIFPFVKFKSKPLLVLDGEVVQLHIFVLNAITHDAGDIIRTLREEGLRTIDLDIVPPSEAAPGKSYSALA